MGIDYYTFNLRGFVHIHRFDHSQYSLPLAVHGTQINRKIHKIKIVKTTLQVARFCWTKVRSARLYKLLLASNAFI
jgi:hypothetical protein